MRKCKSFQQLTASYESFQWFTARMPGSWSGTAVSGSSRHADFSVGNWAKFPAKGRRGRAGLARISNAWKTRYKCCLTMFAPCGNSNCITAGSSGRIVGSCYLTTSASQSSRTGAKHGRESSLKTFLAGCASPGSGARLLSPGSLLAVRGGLINRIVPAAALERR